MLTQSLMLLLVTGTFVLTALAMIGAMFLAVQHGSVVVQRLRKDLPQAGEPLRQGSGSNPRRSHARGPIIKWHRRPTTHSTPAGP